jgi:hypothetical protein
MASLPAYISMTLYVYSSGYVEVALLCAEQTKSCYSPTSEATLFLSLHVDLCVDYVTHRREKDRARLS